MMYSKSCAYAMRGMAWLALVCPEGYVPVHDLCAGSDMPHYFVTKVFETLVRNGLLTSSKGLGGGFALTRAPAKIALLEIVAAIDGTDSLEARACMGGMARCDPKQACPVHDHWQPLRQELRGFLARTTLADMSQSLRTKIEGAGAKVPKPKSPYKALRLNG